MMEECLEEVGKKERIEEEIEAMDRQIDGLVYDLYGVTEEEVKVVEEE
jgi:hypothetical protein